MTNFIKSAFYISVCIILGTSCNEEAVDASDYSQSYGSWVLSKALKDGKATRTLEGTTFEIDTAQIATNLFGADESYKYKRNGSRIQLEGSSSQLFTVDKSTVDTLVLNMKRKRKLFQLLMVRESLSAN